MSKYYKAEDIQELITACMWRMTLAKERGGEGFVEYDKQIIDVGELRKRLNELPTIEVMEYPQVDGITPSVITPEVSEDNEPTWEQVKEYCFKRNYAIVGREMPKEYLKGFVEIGEDAISREYTLKIINAMREVDKDNAVVYGKVYSQIKDAPSVIPQPKEGEWLLDGRCSECLVNPLTTHKNYCPNCGAKMKGTKQ